MGFLCLTSSPVQGGMCSLDNETRLLCGGNGGVYLLAKPGKLLVEIFKQERPNRREQAHLRAILLTPDRQVVEEKWIDDTQKSPKPGQLGIVRFETEVKHAGIYCVNITVTSDRYGNAVYWGMKTNCEKYLIETSRGHKDARHQEPLIFNNPDTAAEVCFLPRDKAFEINIRSLWKDCREVSLLDAGGTTIQTFPVSPTGTVDAKIPATEKRVKTPWRLRLPKFSGVVEIDGLTRWNRNDNPSNLSLWTPDIDSWFDFHGNRWLVTPYSLNLYADSSQNEDLSFTIQNSSPEKKVIDLSLEFPETPWDISLPTSSVELEPQKSTTVTLACQLPPEGNSWRCHLRATPRNTPKLTTYSSLVYHRGAAPAEKPFELPLVLKPYSHENQQFGYCPDYPTEGEMYFAPDNQPYVAVKDGFWTKENGKWKKHLFLKTENREKGASIRLRCSKVAFDASGNAYFIVTHNRKAAMLQARTDGTRKLAAIPGGGSFDIEQFSGHNLPLGPPPFIQMVRTKKDPKHKWRSLNDFSLFVPKYKADGSIDVGEPIRVTRKCIGLSNHSGIPSTLVSRGENIHVTWGEATDPEEKAPGVPTYVATYNCSTRKLSPKNLIGYGPPANDVHNSPCITMDSKGYLHALVGTHGRAFKYARSMAPNRADQGWTKTEDVGPGLRQTYVGLVCDENDTLHLVFRLWVNDKNRFRSSHFAGLTQMSKPAGEPWSAPQVLVVPPFSEYSVYYHRLTIDRQGQLFLSYDYWSTFWFYRTDRARKRTLLTSPNGKVWKLTTNADLAP